MFLFFNQFGQGWEQKIWTEEGIIASATHQTPIHRTNKLSDVVHCSFQEGSQYTQVILVGQK